MTKQTKSESGEFSGATAPGSSGNLNSAISAFRRVGEKLPMINKMGISDLCALVDIALIMQDTLMAFSGSPRFGDYENNEHSGHEMLDWINDACGFLAQAVVDRLHDLTPDEDEFNNYLEAVVRWELRCGNGISGVTSEMMRLTYVSGQKQRGTQLTPRRSIRKAA